MLPIGVSGFLVGRKINGPLDPAHGVGITLGFRQIATQGIEQVMAAGSILIRLGQVENPLQIGSRVVVLAELEVGVGAEVDGR